MLQRMQKRFARLLPGHKGVSYKEMLNRMGMFSHRRMKGDLIRVYKIMRNIDISDHCLFPPR